MRQPFSRQLLRESSKRAKDQEAQGAREGAAANTTPKAT
jgi:hypothetical protein